MLPYKKNICTMYVYCNWNKQGLWWLLTANPKSRCLIGLLEPTHSKAEQSQQTQSKCKYLQNGPQVDAKRTLDQLSRSILVLGCVWLVLCNPNRLLYITNLDILSYSRSVVRIYIFGRFIGSKQLYNILNLKRSVLILKKRYSVLTTPI